VDCSNDKNSADRVTKKEVFRLLDWRYSTRRRRERQRTRFTLICRYRHEGRSWSEIGKIFRRTKYRARRWYREGSFYFADPFKTSFFSKVKNLFGLVSER
jgi:hypothetical protein